MFSCAAKVAVAVVDIDRCLGGVDHRLLNLELGLLADDRGLCRRDIGLGLVERDLEVALVDPGERLARVDTLIVADQHVAQVARNLGGNGGVVSLYIGVVGRDQILADGPVIPAIPGRAGQRGHRRAGH